MYNENCFMIHTVLYTILEVYNTVCIEHCRVNNKNYNQEMPIYTQHNYQKHIFQSYCLKYYINYIAIKFGLVYTSFDFLIRIIIN